MPDTHVNLIHQGIASVASSGLGTITLGSAVTGMRALASPLDGLTLNGASLTVALYEGNDKSVETGCVYDSGAGTLARGTVESSTTGLRLAMTAAGTVRVVLPASLANRSEYAAQSVTPGGRLTLESGVPVSTTDQTAKTTVYYTPFVSNVISLWDGARWVPTQFAETSLALGTLTSGLPYDVFAYLSSGALALELLAWTNSTTRATAVTLQDGRYCKSGDKTRLLLGGFVTTSTTATADSDGFRLVDNVYNKVNRRGYKQATSNHTYNSGTRRAWNGATSNKLDVFCALPQSVLVSLNGGVQGNADGRYATISVGLNTHTGDKQFEVFTSTAQEMLVGGSLAIALPAGYSYLGVMEEQGGIAGDANFISYWLSANFTR